MSSPVSSQPQKAEMQATGLPPSLQYLAGIDQVIVKQKLEMFEVSLDYFETRNTYAVLNNQGQQIFFVEEESSLCERCFMPLNRGLTLHVTDHNTQITDPSLTTRVGNIAKQWGGVCVEAFTDANTFSLTFPADMTVECKALLLGAFFLTEFYVFEQQKKTSHKSREVTCEW